MNTRPGRSFLFLLILLGRLPAGEWSHWGGVGGDATYDRSANVVARSRRDEDGDQADKRYLFVYELHNQSGTQAARVFLYFPVQDSATGRWKEIDRDAPTIVHDLPPLGTVKGSQYSPSVRGLNYESDVKWPEELAAESERKAAAGAQQGSVPDAGAPGSKSDATQTEFEGVPLSDKAALEQAARKYLEREARFRATIVFQLPPGETMWQGIEGDTAVDRSGTWRERMEDWFAFVQRTDLTSHYRLQIVSVTESEMTVRFEDVTADHLVSYLDTSEYGWGGTNQTVVLELALVEPGETAVAVASEGKPAPQPGSRGNQENGPADQGPEKVIPASQPAAKAGMFEATVVAHSGYWFDPDDKDAKGDDPVIYVRVAGQAKRVRLEAAKEAYGIPATASRDTMSHYSERQGS